MNRDTGEIRRFNSISDAVAAGFKEPLTTLEARRLRMLPPSERVAAFDAHRAEIEAMRELRNPEKPRTR